MEAERYIVREVEGYNITPGSAPSGTARTSLAVCVLDSRWNYRLVREFRSEYDHGYTSHGYRVSWGEARRQVRTQAAELATRLNAATP
jgi:hypothetical protein